MKATMTETIPKSSEGVNHTKSSIETAASALGLMAFYPDDHELQLDVDKPFGTCAENDRVVGVLASNGVRMPQALVTKSKSGNTHIYLRMQTPLTRLMRIALQACLGSDPVREALSALRELEAAEETTALFETPEEATRVLAWRAKFVPKDPMLALILDDDIPY